MANLGFLGLGIMGYPMARHLLDAGHRVALWSKTAGKAAELAHRGDGVECATPADVARQADTIFYCVGDTAMSEGLLFGPDGLAEAARPGTVIADCSTVAPALAKRAYQTLAARGIHFLDAPCTGSKPGAEGGTLTFMVGGDEEVFERTRPLFEAMGKNLYFCGGPGMGLHAKLTQNLVLANLMQALNEGFVLAVKAGVDPERLLDILTNSAARSGLASFKMPFIFGRDFATNFSTKWMHKDVGLMLESAAELDVPLPLTGLTRQLFQTAISMGYGEDDFCSTVKVYEQWAGVEIHSERES